MNKKNMAGLENILKQKISHYISTSIFTNQNQLIFIMSIGYIQYMKKSMKYYPVTGLIQNIV